jgi:hypothetical protein
MTLPPVPAAWGFEMIVLLAAGIGVCVMGLLAIGFGIPISDTSFGNALLIAGVVILCTGMVLLGMWFVARELSNVAKRMLAQLEAAARPVAAPRPAEPANPFAAAVGDPLYAEEGADRAGASASPPPWADEIASRGRPGTFAPEMPPIEPVEAPPPPAPDRPARRNLLFATKRRDKAELEPTPASSPPAFEAQPTVSFENAWPNPSRANGVSDRLEPSIEPADATNQEAEAASSTPPHDEAPPAEVPTLGTGDLPPGVTIVRSGTVDDMAYTYYSDGSIEAQLAGESPIRFASLDELRTYVEQRK